MSISYTSMIMRRDILNSRIRNVQDAVVQWPITKYPLKDGIVVNVVTRSSLSNCFKIAVLSDDDLITLENSIVCLKRRREAWRKRS